MSVERFAEIAASLGIPSNLVSMVAPEAPARGKMAIAQGMFPAPPRALVSMMYLLIGDADGEVASTASRSLGQMPGKILADVVGSETHPKILEFIAYHNREPLVLEKVALQRQVGDKTLCYLAETGPERVVEIIANNQERLLIVPELYLHLRVNPLASRALLERVETFQRMCGIDLSHVELQQSTPASTPPVPSPATPSLPPQGPDMGSDPTSGGEEDPLSDLFAELGLYEPISMEVPAPPNAPQREEPLSAQEGARPQIVINGEALSHLSTLADSTFSFGYDDGADAFDEELITDHDSVGDDLVSSISSKVSKLTIGQKIKLAYVGNKEVRELLVRDRNKMVAGAVVKSGRMTEPEVVRVSSNRAISGEVLRLIATDREWTRLYPVKVALVNNPKCPVPVAIGFISALQARDLKMLSNNKNVSSVVFTTATRLVRERKA